MRAEQTSFLFGANAPFIEELYGRYVADAGSVDPEWRTFFEALYQCVVQGIFADPIYGGNKDKAGWKLIGFPGVVATHAKNIVQYKNKPFPVTYLGIADLA